MAQGVPLTCVETFTQKRYNSFEDKNLIFLKGVWESDGNDLKEYKVLNKRGGKLWKNYYVHL